MEFINIHAIVNLMTTCCELNDEFELNDEKTRQY